MIKYFSDINKEDVIRCEITDNYETLHIAQVEEKFFFITGSFM